MYKQTPYTICTSLYRTGYRYIEKKERNKNSHKIQNFEFVKIKTNTCWVHTTTSINVCTSNKQETCQKVSKRIIKLVER